MESKVNKYALNIIWSDNDEGYIATCRQFPGLSAFGETPEAALFEARVAIELFIKTYEEDRIPIPEPQGVLHYSGQFRLRLPQSLHAQLASMADAEGVSLNQFVLDALAERVGAQKIHKQMLQEMGRAISNLVTQTGNLYQSANWPPPKLEAFAIEQTSTTAASLRRTAGSKGIIKRGQ